MPRRVRANIGRRSRRTQNRSNERRNASQEQNENRNQIERERLSRSRSGHSPQERAEHNEQDRLRMQGNRQRQRRAAQTHVNVALNGAGFRYNNAIDYSLHKFVVIGAMDKVCQYCNAFKFGTETPGICCASGKVRLPDLQYPPEPLATLLSGTTPVLRHFLDKIQMYSSCFQMTSFGVTIVIRDNFMPTFKVISPYGISNETVERNSQFCEIFTSFDQSFEYFASTLQIQGQVYHKIPRCKPSIFANLFPWQ